MKENLINRRFFFLLVIQLALFGCTNSADVPARRYYNISGTILHSDGKTPVANTKIDLFNRKSPRFSLGPTVGESFASSKTNSNGGFSFQVPLTKALGEAEKEGSLAIDLHGEGKWSEAGFIDLESKPGKVYVVPKLDGFHRLSGNPQPP